MSAKQRKYTTAEKLDIIKKFLGRFFKQFGTALIAASIVGYVFLQLILNTGDLIETENATYASVNESIKTDAFIFREETVLESSGEGSDCFLIADGEKVRKNQTVAVTYANDTDAATQEKINELDARIAILKKSSLGEGASTTSISVIDDEIDKILMGIIRSVDDNAIYEAIREHEELMILMNRRQALVHESDYLKEIESLTAERDRLSATLSGASYSLSSPESGYFYSHVDGYEDIFTTDVLSSLTVDKYFDLFSSVPDDGLIASSTGKLIVGSTWYVAIGIDKRTAEKFIPGNAYPVVFPYSNNMTLDLTLERKVTKTNSDTVVLVMSSKQMPESFDYSRCQKIELLVTVYEGIRVSAECIRVNNGVEGVYVLLGNRVLFKDAAVIYRHDNYVICSIPVPENGYGESVSYISSQYLSLHDLVITSGSDIYDGKILT